MKAIVTKYHPATETRGSYYSARAEGVPRLKLACSESKFTPEQNHRAVAEALANRYGWLAGEWRLEGGGLPDGTGEAFVFVREGV